MSRWISETVLILGCIAIGYLLHHPRPAPVPAPVSRLHVLAVGDSVQVGGVKGEIVKCCVVPNGRSVVVEIRTKGETK